MSFFNLTELGADNIVRASVTDQSLESRNNSASKEGTPVSSKFDETVLPNSLANGSHKKYIALLQKHQRSPIGKDNFLSLQNGIFLLSPCQGSILPTPLFEKKISCLFFVSV